MLELQGLSFIVTESTTSGPEIRRSIVQGIDVCFQAGKFYAVTGPNGSGKSTLARLIMGIDSPSAGRVWFRGEDITLLTLPERARRGLAYGFQHPARFKGMRFRDLLATAAGSSDEQTLVGLMTQVGICSLDFLDKLVDGKLSGGELKKIELATVLARHPLLAIYDEPDTGIDLWSVGPMVELLKREQENGTTTIVISHNEKFLRVADEIVLIRDGRIAHVGDLASTLPLLNDLDFCHWLSICAEGQDARCRR